MQDDLPDTGPDDAAPALLQDVGLQALIDLLRQQGYSVIGPTVQDAAIVYGEITSLADLPAGWTDEQEAGQYRLRRREDAALFGYNLGPQSWKRFLYPPRVSLWRCEGEGQTLDFVPVPDPVRPFAFLGVRACELQAIRIQDRVLLGGTYQDPHYRRRREGALFIAVNCGQAARTCFCVSMGTGPEATEGFDLVLTELISDGTRSYLTRAGSPAGARLLAGLTGQRPAQSAEIAAAGALLQRTAATMGRALDAAEAPALLRRNLEHPRWDEVAERCLACGNCTMVCPTCFCSTVEDHTSLTGGAERSRRWDSCFSADFSWVHGGGVRGSIKSRYRQWLTHKLSSWHEQFGSSGCVGCGRCIAWCPVGIDISAEVRAIAAGEAHREDGP